MSEAVHVHSRTYLVDSARQYDFLPTSHKSSLALGLLLKIVVYSHQSIFVSIARSFIFEIGFDIISLTDRLESYEQNETATLYYDCIQIDLEVVYFDLH